MPNGLLSAASQPYARGYTKVGEIRAVDWSKGAKSAYQCSIQVATFPSERLLHTMTSCWRFTNSPTRWLPIKSAPPAIRWIFLAIGEWPQREPDLWTEVGIAPRSGDP